jgi:hypothetical protein
VAALDAATGQALWLEGLGAPSGQRGPSVVDDVPALAVSGTNLFMVGTAYGSSATFGSLSVSNSGASGQYFARYGTNGSPQLAVGFGSPTTRPWAAAANASGEVYVSGDFDTYSEFGADIISAPRNQTLGPDYFGQGFLAKFDANGNALWARSAQATGLVNFRGVALVSNGAWASGFCDGVTTFGTNSLWSDYTVVGFPVGTIVYTEAGVLGEVLDTVGAAPRPSLAAAEGAGRTILLTLKGTPGTNYILEYTASLVPPPTWQTQQVVLQTNVSQTITLPAPQSGSRALFYRLEQE